MAIETPGPAAPRPPRWNKPLWLIGLALVANAAVYLYTHGRPELILDRSAFAQAAPTAQMLGARGIYMMPAQLGPQTFGIYLMDVDSSTITVYRTNPENARLRLASVRSFRYDRFLEDFNNDTQSLSPKQVQKLVEEQRSRTDIKSKDEVPTVDQNPKPDENRPDTK